MIWIFMAGGEGDKIKSKQASKRDRILTMFRTAIWADKNWFVSGRHAWTSSNPQVTIKNYKNLYYSRLPNRCILLNKRIGGNFFEIC